MRAFLAFLLLLPSAANAAQHWVTSWSASQQAPEPANVLPGTDFTDATLRQIIHVSLGGTRLRVRLSNAFGTAPLVIDAAHLARAISPGRATILSGSDRALTFAGRPGVTIPAGADYWSDPVFLDVPALSSLAVSFHVPAAPLGQTGHPGSRATSYYVHGDRTGASDFPDAGRIDHWYNLAAIEIAGQGRARSIVTLGDSITDGHGATTNGDDRWPDELARRLQAGAATRDSAVANQGIGGNRILRDGLGPNALARFDRDVLAQSGVRAVMVLEGINDLGTLTRDAPADASAHGALVAAITAAYAQMIERAHGHGIQAIGCTILPDGGSSYYHPDAINEADRQAVNAWIRAPGHFDAVVDFDAALRDPADPGRMQARFDSGDHLHPSPAGYRAMAAAVPLSIFALPQSVRAAKLKTTKARLVEPRFP